MCSPVIREGNRSIIERDHSIFFLNYFHTFLYTPSTFNPKP